MASDLVPIEIDGEVYWGKVTDELAQVDGDITYALVVTAEQMRHIQEWLLVDDYELNVEKRVKKVSVDGEAFVGRVRMDGSYRSMGGDRYAFSFSLGPVKYDL